MHHVKMQNNLALPRGRAVSSPTHRLPLTAVQGPAGLKVSTHWGPQWPKTQGPVGSSFPGQLLRLQHRGFWGWSKGFPPGTGPVAVTTGSLE